jgi:hypothetical protein
MSYVEPGFGLVLNFAMTVVEIIDNTLVIFPSIKCFITTTIAEPITHEGTHIQIEKVVEETR